MQNLVESLDRLQQQDENKILFRLANDEKFFEQKKSARVESFQRQTRFFQQAFHSQI